MSYDVLIKFLLISCTIIFIGGYLPYRSRIREAEEKEGIVIKESLIDNVFCFVGEYIFAAGWGWLLFFLFSFIGLFLGIGWECPLHGAEVGAFCGFICLIMDIRNVSIYNKKMLSLHEQHKNLYPHIQKILRKDSKLNSAPIKNKKLIKYRIYYDKRRENIYLVINRDWTGDKNLYVYNAVEGDFNLLAEENDLVTGVTNLMFISQGTEYGVEIFNDMDRILLNNRDKIAGYIDDWREIHEDVFL